jgi:hypothetical protein
MKKYEYLTYEIKVEELDEKLKSCGKYGWEFKQLIVMQRQLPNKLNISGMQALQVEIKFLLIFIKEIVEIKN